MPGFRGLTALSSSPTSVTSLAPPPRSEASLSPNDLQARRVQSLGNTQERATAVTLLFKPEVGGGALELLLMGFRMSSYSCSFSH